MSRLYAVKLADGSWWSKDDSSHVTAFRHEEVAKSHLRYWQTISPGRLIDARVIRLEEAPDAR